MKFKESDATELKKSVSQLDDALKSICAFLNHKGGVVYFGVGDDGGVIGLQVSDKTLRKISQQIHSRIKPEFNPEIKEVKEKGKSIIQVKVPEGSNKPYFLNGIAYRKVGSEKRIIPPDELKRIILEQKKTRWDERICEGAGLKDIDKEKVRQFMIKANAERNLNIDPKIPLKEALEKLDLFSKNKIKNAAILLFGRNPQKFFSQVETRCGRFKGTKPLEFIDMKVFGGTIINQVNAAEDFVLRHINKAAWVEKGEVERKERWEYPPDAVREAIVNAICHRDYEVSSNVQVRIFDDRVEIWGCGSLLPPLTVEELKKKHKSILRNRLIGDCFFLMKYIEEWGTGTNKIVEWCLDHGLPEPLFEVVAGDLVVTLRKEITEEFLRESGLSERQIKAVSYVREKGKITNREYQDLFNISKRTASADLSDLVEKKVLKKIGRGKRGLKYVLH